MRTPPTLLALTLVLVLGGGLAACGSDEGGALPQKQLEDDISARLGAQTGSSPTVTCPGGLAAKTGNALRCRAEIGGTSYGITVTVTGTEGGTAQYELQVDPAAS